MMNEEKRAFATAFPACALRGFSVILGARKALPAFPKRKRARFSRAPPALLFCSVHALERNAGRNVAPCQTVSRPRLRINRYPSFKNVQPVRRLRGVPYLTDSFTCFSLRIFAGVVRRRPSSSRSLWGQGHAFLLCGGTRKARTGNRLFGLPPLLAFYE